MGVGYFRLNRLNRCDRRSPGVGRNDSCFVPSATKSPVIVSLPSVLYVVRVGTLVRVGGKGYRSREIRRREGVRMRPVS